MTDFLEVARSHTALGYYVFPTHPGSKEPLRRSRGVHDATRDERQLLHWSLVQPKANVAIAPGASGATVLDIDSKAGASPRDVLGELDLDERDLVLVWSGEAPEPDEQHPHSLAGERGAHVWFAGARPTVPKTRIRGVEIRSEGVYVLAPGSSHPSGVLYDGALRYVRALPPAPASVIELHEHGAEEFGTGHLIVPKDGEPIESPRAPQLLGWALGNVFGLGVLDGAALERMLAENQARVTPPLPPAEVRRLWAWGNKSRVARSARRAAATDWGPWLGAKRERSAR